MGSCYRSGAPLARDRCRFRSRRLIITLCARQGFCRVGFWPLIRSEDDRSACVHGPRVVPPREPEGKETGEAGGEDTQRPIRLLFYFRFERLSTFPFFLCPRAVNATQAAPFIRETSRAIQAPFQLEIETRSFEIPVYVVRFFVPKFNKYFFVSSGPLLARPRSHANARRRNFLQACSFVQEFSRKREGKASSFWTFDHLQGQRVSD